MSTSNKYFCGTPTESCTGSVSPLWERVTHSKSHSSPTEAFDCYRKYLIRQGYTQVDSRAFRPPDGGPILILTKKSRFGGHLRRGKSEGVGKGAARFMPKHRISGMVYG